MTSYRKGNSCLPCILFAVTIVPYFVGFPAEGRFFEIELMATITDKNGQIIKQYKRTGKHTSWDAIWGYGNGGYGIERGASAGAVADAAAMLIEDINTDFTTISAKLSAL